MLLAISKDVSLRRPGTQHWKSLRGRRVRRRLARGSRDAVLGLSAAASVFALSHHVDAWIKLVSAVVWASSGLLHLRRVDEIAARSGITAATERWSFGAGALVGGIGTFVVSRVGRRSTLLVVAVLCTRQFVWICYVQRETLGLLELAAGLGATGALVLAFEWMYERGKVRASPQWASDRPLSGS